MKERDQLALNLRRSGKTLKEVGLELGVGKERARNLIARAERQLLPRTPHWTDGLDKKTANNLAFDYSSKDELRSAVLNGSFLQRGGIGPKTYEAIKLWLSKA